jgi:hypothetical protein
MIKAPSQMPAVAETEFVRGKYQERNGATVVRPNANFDPRGNDVWAERSGRTYFASGLSGSGHDSKDYSAPVVGSGTGRLSALVGGRVANHLRAGATPDYDVDQMMVDGSKRNKGMGKKSDSADMSKPKRKNARAQVVAKVMREKGLKLIEASKYVKEHGLY